MRMSTTDISQFSKLVEYVRYRMPQVVHVPRIVRNMRLHGSLRLAELRTALVWGSTPLIVIADLSAVPAPDGSGLVSANGRFDPAKPNQIELDLGRVNQFETDAFGAGSDTTGDGRKVFIVGTTLLHELCHWGNFHHGTAEATEQGIEFEVATYGRNTG